jgi:heme ABC exporter ATP-binding subunit CcmA
VPSDSAAIQLDAVSRLYGEFAALRKVTATFSVGNCYVITGDNGAGKSTLLRVIAGLLHPTLGVVQIFGSPEIQYQRRRIGYLSHASMLYDELTALENLRYTAALYAGMPTLTPQQALALVGLDPALKRPIGQYSQGMRQRTALARVLLAQPELLLLDEPFSSIDAASAEQMLRVLADLRAQQCTILLTTHQPELTRSLANAFVHMRQGEIVHFGTAPAVAARPPA